MKRGWLIVAMIACVFGVICSGISLNNYVRIQGGGLADGESFCSVSEFVNCDIVEASSYAAVNGFPIAAFGVIYYLILLGLAVYSRFSGGFRMATVAFAWWTTIPAVLYSILLFYISVSVLGAICLTCIGMYAANFALFAAFWCAMGVPVKDGLKFVRGYWTAVFTRKKDAIGFRPGFANHLIVAVVSLAIGFAVISGKLGSLEKHKMSGGEIGRKVEEFLRQGSYDIKIDTEKTPMWGTKDSPVTIVEFSDFRCPFCRLAAFSIRPAINEHRKNVAYYFVNYPLDSSCNAYMERQMHPGACLAAAAAICADNFGKFWEYHDELFRTAAGIDAKLVMKLAKKLDINEKAFSECLESAETDRKLKEDIETARKAYITGTPSVFVNNRHLIFWRNPEFVRAVVEKMLEK